MGLTMFPFFLPVTIHFLFVFVFSLHPIYRTGNTYTAILLDNVGRRSLG